MMLTIKTIVLTFLSSYYVGVVNLIQPKEPECRKCCEVSVEIGNLSVNGEISVKNCSGNWFTSCETAQKKSCDNALKALEDMLNCDLDMIACITPF